MSIIEDGSQQQNTAAGLRCASAGCQLFLWLGLTPQLTTAPASLLMTLFIK
jgi:hypothetical protein